MARRSPGALRAQHRAGYRDAAKIRPIDGLSARANAAIVRLGLGSAPAAFASYRRAIQRSGRWVELHLDICCGDPVDDRDVLEDALRNLPLAASRELRRLVVALDEEFLRKTLPDPLAAERSAWHAQGWWRQRLHDR
jgi:hypothetical protein